MKTRFPLFRTRIISRSLALGLCSVALNLLPLARAQLRVEPPATNPAKSPPAPFTNAQFLHYSFLPTSPNDPEAARWYFRLWVPPSYNPASGTKYPVVFFLHGAGENGTNTQKQMQDNGQYAFCEAANQAIFPCFVIMPQSSAEAKWRGQSAVDLLAALAEVYAIDRDRAVVTGLSMGAASTLGWLSTHPQAWAAGAPLSCYPPSNLNPDAFVNVPFWIFHSKNDGNLPYTAVSQSDNIVNKLRTRGGRPIYTRFSTGGHSATSWRAAYRHPHFIRWLAEQRRGQPMTYPVGVTLTSPTSEPVFGTTAGSVTLAGTTTDRALGGVTTPVSLVFWVDGNADFNATGNLTTGTVSSWTATTTPSLGLHRVSVVARASSLNNSLSGYTDYTDALALTRATTNSAPTVNAGADTAVALANVFALSGTVADDGLPSGATLTQTWTQQSGPATATLATPQALNCGVTFPQIGTYVFRLTATDTALAASDEITVEVVSALVPSAKILVDFGLANDVTSGSWNNVTNYAAGTVLTGLRSTTGATTGIALRLTQAFTNINGNGTTGSALYPSTATKDNFYVQTDAPGVVRLEGLDPSARYDLRVYASRMGAGVVRLTDYRAGTQVVTLDATDNLDASAVLANLPPDAAGQLTLEVIKPTASAFGYLSVLEIAERTTDTFAHWQSENFPTGTPASLSNADADPDYDGSNNLSEYAFGTDPLIGNASPLTVGRGSALQIAFPALARPDIVYVVQASSDLVAWTEITRRAPFSATWQGTAVVAESGSGNYRMTTVTDVVSIATEPRRFLRVQILQAP